MSIKKGMLVVTLASGLAILGSGALSTTNSLGRNSNILPSLQLKMNNGEFHISSLNDIKEMNRQIENGAQVREATLDNDLDLTGMTSSDLSNLNTTYGGIPLEINGNGYSVKNKPEDLFFQPIFGSAAAGYDGKLYVHNITFDNAPIVFSKISTTAVSNSVSSNHEETGGNITDDRILDDSAATSENTMYFQNVSIINTNLENQTFDASSAVSTFETGLLSQSVLLDEGGNEASDTVIRFNGLNLSNNKINNNTINFLNTPSIINFGFSNFNYTVCSNTDHHHIGLIGFKNVIIQDNEFLGNVFTGTDENTVFSFSPLMSSFEFDGTSWVGSGGNFLKLESIIIQNNSFEKPEGISDNNFKYSDLISQSIDLALASSLYTDVEALQEVISLNNNVYMDYESETYYQNPNIITIENVGLNSWTQADADKLFFIGNSYDENNNLNLFVDETGNANFNNIYHGKALNYKNDASEWNDMLLMLQRKFGIYGVSMQADSEKNLERINIGAVNSLTDPEAANEDSVQIIDVKTQQSSNSAVEKIMINFNLLLGSANNIDDAGEMITEPVTVNNVVLLNNGEVITKSNSDSYNPVNAAELNYSYAPEFAFENPITSFNPEDYSTLQMRFDYTDGVTRFARTTTVDLDAQELYDIWVINGSNPITDPGLAVSAGVLGGVVGLILLILLILLLLFLYRRHQVSKVKEVQDGYYEFEDDGAGFDDNSQYGGQYNDYYEDYNDDQTYYDENYEQEYVDNEYNEEYSDIQEGYYENKDFYQNEEDSSTYQENNYEEEYSSYQEDDYENYFEDEEF